MIETILTQSIKEGFKSLFNADVEEKMLQLQKTRKDFEGDITLVVFSLLRLSKKSPEQTGEAIGNYLKENLNEITDFNVVKGFLNLTIAPSYWVKRFLEIQQTENFGFTEPTADSETVMVEYSSPNTNKPLHLGHIRNNLLGFSINEIIKANGKKVIKTNIVNDRGIHICKSMIAWQKFGNGETPESSGMKGDHLVGKYYVVFDKEYKKQINELVAGGKTEEEAKKTAPIILEAQELLRKWENEFEPSKTILKLLEPKIKKYHKNWDIGFKISKKTEKQDIEKVGQLLNSHIYFIEPLEALESVIQTYKEKSKKNETDKLILRRLKRQKKELSDLNRCYTVYRWKTMNQWVYDGFDVTYKRLGVDFDKIYYESDTFLIGKETVLDGLKKGILIQKEDTSVWADLTNDGLDQKILLRSDGTSVYMTQDIGTAQLRQQDYNFQKLVYVVGNEQEYHFKVLSLILDKLGFEWAKDLYHLSYGMVELPEGKMKSREGTVVDADDLMDEMINTSREMSKELGKLEGYSEEEKENIFRIIGLGSLKYFILKVDPRKNMTFNPKESIDFNGNTGPFIQYTYARIRSVLRKAEENGINFDIAINDNLQINAKEIGLIKMIADFPAIVKLSGDEYNPAFIANYTYELVKEYNQFYHDYSILKEENSEIKNFRLLLSETIAETIEKGMKLLGIEMPERM